MRQRLKIEIFLTSDHDHGLKPYHTTVQHCGKFYLAMTGGHQHYHVRGDNCRVSLDLKHRQNIVGDKHNLVPPAQHQLAGPLIGQREVLVLSHQVLGLEWVLPTNLEISYPGLSNDFLLE